MIPLQKYDVRDEDEEVLIYNENALLLYLEEPIDVPNNLVIITNFRRRRS